MGSIKNTDHVSAPTPLVHNGVTYLQSPPTIGDFVAVKKYMIETELAALDKAVGSVASKDLRDYAMAKGMREIDEIEVNSSRFNALLGSRPEYQMYMVWMVLRHNHPDVTMEVVTEIFNTQIAKEIETARDKVLAKAGYSENPNDEPPTPRKAAGKRA